MAAKQPTDLDEVATTDDVIDDLAGVVELAEMLGVTRFSIYRYIALTGRTCSTSSSCSRAFWPREPRV